MAKHVHKFMLQGNKTWRCVRQDGKGCAFFVHRGLEHVLINKVNVCWVCEEDFVFDEGALKYEKPMCIDCRIQTRAVMENEVPEQMSPEKRAMYKSMGLIK